MNREFEENPAPLPDAQDHFVNRWSRLKQASANGEAEVRPDAQQDEQPDTGKALTDADMPDIDSLTPDSDYAGFLAPQVSESLRRLALRKLFQGAQFNVRDGLDDYDQDFTSFTKLGDVITADMKHMLEQELRRAEERKAAEEADDANSIDYEEIGEEKRQAAGALSEPAPGESENPEEQIDEPPPE